MYSDETEVVEYDWRKQVREGVERDQALLRDSTFTDEAAREKAQIAIDVATIVPSQAAAIFYLDDYGYAWRQSRDALYEDVRHAIVMEQMHGNDYERVSVEQYRERLLEIHDGLQWAFAEHGELPPQGYLRRIAFEALLRDVYALPAEKAIMYRQWIEGGNMDQHAARIVTGQIMSAYLQPFRDYLERREARKPSSMYFRDGIHPSDRKWDALLDFLRCRRFDPEAVRVYVSIREDPVKREQLKRAYRIRYEIGQAVEILSRYQPTHECYPYRKRELDQLIQRLQTEGGGLIAWDCPLS